VFLYARYFKNKCPPDLGTLVGFGPLAADRFLSPRLRLPAPPPGMTTDEAAAWVNAHSDFLLPAAGRSAFKFTQEDPILYENPARAGTSDGLWIVFADGRIEFRELRWALETIARPRR
jgi:hypothetical protein